MLTYRFTWTGASLGELAATIPLSPGEERTVTISVSQKTERSRSSTATSLTDVTRIDRADFETFFEREVRREKDVTASAETEASGSYGWFSGSAKISGSVSTRDMSRQLNRSVQRASQEVNRRAKEGTTVSVSERTESTSSNTTTYKVKNINEGRTLNVSFYRILNSFRSALQLNDFAFSVVGGVEIIAGSGIRERRTFPRDQICDFFDYLFSAAVLPFDSLSSQARQKLAGEIVKQLARQLLDEMEPKKATFATSKPSVAEASLTFDELKALSTQSFAMQKLLPSMNHMAFSQLLAKLSEKDFCEFITNAFATENCELSGLVGRFFEDTSFAHDSGGLYADVIIGQVPATEPYSENMRELEQRKQEAEIRLKHARASLFTSRASRQLLGVAQAIDPRKVYVTERDALYFTDRHVSLRLRLVPAAFFDTGWVVVISSEGRFLQTNTFDGVLYFDLPIRFGAGGVDIGNKPSSWFKANVTIEHPELGLTIGYKEEP